MKYSLKFQMVKRDTKKKSFPICCRVSYNGVRVDLRIGLSIPEECWDAERQSAHSRQASLKKICNEANNKILQVSTKIGELFSRCELLEQRFPSRIEVQSIIDDKPFKNKISEVTALFLKDNSHLSKNTVKLYNATLNQFLKYEGDLMMSEISSTVMLHFCEEMSEQLVNSSIHSFVEKLKVVIRWAKNQGYYNGDALSFKLKYKLVEGNIIYLTRDELMTLWQFDDLTKTERVVKMHYLLCAFTGLRFSDASKLTWHDISADKIHIVTQKTNDPLTIELNNYSRQIIEYYKKARVSVDDKVATSFIVYYHEKVLKRIFKKLGFNDMISSVYYQGNDRKIETKPKWEYLTTHTARKTFVVNALSLGIPVEVVMRWTGHKNMKAIRPYLKIVDSIKRHNMDKFNDL